MPGLNLGNLPERFADDYSSIVIIAAIITVYHKLSRISRLFLLISV